MSDDPYRLYFQVPETRIDLRHIKKVCIQTADGKELWFEPNSSVEALMRKLAEALKRAELAERSIEVVK